MSYYFNKTLELPIDAAIARVTAALAERGFGVLMDIDVQATIKKKLDKDMPAYRILGACHPGFAYEALMAENKIGTMLPCSIIVRDAGNGTSEVAAVDPIASMQAVDNADLADVAIQVREHLESTIASL